MELRNPEMHVSSSNNDTDDDDNADDNADGNDDDDDDDDDEDVVWLTAMKMTLITTVITNSHEFS